ncbi:MAG: hypothetical protein ACMUIE_09575 [Thermoplasmatota archaeon]
MKRKRIIMLWIIIGLVLGIIGTILMENLFEDEEDEEEDGGMAIFQLEYAPVIEPLNFVKGVDGFYLPLTTGTKWIYEGETEEGREHIEVVVLNETRTVMGVECVVVRDTVQLEGEIIEDTYDWYAQDILGNVWYFGEDSSEMEDGEVVSKEGSWEAGVDGALPGIIMLAEPMSGLTYRQEYYEGEAEDMGTVIKMGESVATPHGNFDDCLRTCDWTPLEPDAREFKYYAPGIGLVLETSFDGSESIELIDIEYL